MKVKAIIFVTAMLIVALAFSVSSPASPRPAAKAVPTATSQPTPDATADPATPERHPEIQAAISALRRAKEHMEHAAHDFGGHRAEALRATDDAIQQLEIALKFDK
jgi:hypothetical protein